jgi:hypothetical protein
MGPISHTPPGGVGAILATCFMARFPLGMSASHCRSDGYDPIEGAHDGGHVQPRDPPAHRSPPARSP